MNGLANRGFFFPPFSVASREAATATAWCARAMQRQQLRGTVIAPYGRQFKWRSRRQEIYNTTQTAVSSPAQPTSIVEDVTLSEI